MARKKIYCPNCGHQTIIDEEKEQCFCLECGYKIALLKEYSDHSESNETNSTKDEKPEVIQEDVINRKLEEVEFYYNLSREKGELYKQNENPVFYLKAQDLLVDLSQNYVNDYRIWWELCKPIDFLNEDESVSDTLKYQINEHYFGKALDLATIETKKKLIKEQDAYEMKKKRIKLEAQKVIAKIIN